MTKSSTLLTTRTDISRPAVQQRVVFLFGPTGVGKTELLFHLFSTGFSVVNADSMQVYRHLDIGSAKPSPEIRAALPHYLVDIHDPWEQFSVGDFIRLADEACADIASQGKIPVISGGTAYYFKHFLYGLSDAPASNPIIREQVSKQLEEHGLAWCFELLSKVDPISATRIHPSDAYRITRALEVYEGAGKPLSSYALPKVPRNGMQPLIIGLQRDFEELKLRIARRVSLMFEQGLLDEIRSLVRLGAQESWPGMQGIGYQEFFRAMKNGELSLEGIADQIVRNSRLYAKRQNTFFKSFADVQWMHPEDEDGIRRLLDSYLEN